jgi:hypothetical protein
VLSTIVTPPSPTPGVGSMLVAGCNSDIVWRFPTLLSLGNDDTEPVNVPETEDARANAGSTAPTNMSMEIRETAELTARRTLFFLRAFR